MCLTVTAMTSWTRMMSEMRTTSLSPRPQQQYQPDRWAPHCLRHPVLSPNCKRISFILGLRKRLQAFNFHLLLEIQLFGPSNKCLILDNRIEKLSNTWIEILPFPQVGSNTPSVVGESLENFSLEGVQQQGETVKKAWVSNGTKFIVNAVPIVQPKWLPICEFFYPRK